MDALVETFMIAMLMLVVCYYIMMYIKNRQSHWDYGRIHSVVDMRILEPRSVESLQSFLRRNDAPVCVKGAGYSHGGQTMAETSTQICLDRLDTISYDPLTTYVTVGAGARWFDVLTHLARHTRTIAEMQSYHNFSVGGAIAVNCHGRGTQYGSISDTVVTMDVMLANGQIVTCNHTESYDLFRGVIGGYSLLGIILKATLLTVDNIMLDLVVTRTRSSDFMKHRVAENAVLYNCNLYPMRYDEAVSYTWIRSEGSSQDDAGDSVREWVQPKKRWYWAHMALEQVLRRTSLLKYLRAYVEPVTRTLGHQIRSFATAEDANKLDVLSRHPSTTVLQEYFVPVENAQPFIDAIIPRLDAINVINVSLRFVKPAKHCVLNYAPTSMVAIVLYLNIWNDDAGMTHFTDWNNGVLDLLKTCDGTYYLPYMLTYDPRKVRALYRTRWEDLMELKKRYDPCCKMRNTMYAHMNSRLPAPELKEEEENK